MQNQDLVRQLEELLDSAKAGKIQGGVGVFYPTDQSLPGGTVMVAECDPLKSRMLPDCSFRWTAAAAIERHLTSRFDRVSEGG